MAIGNQLATQRKSSFSTFLTADAVKNKINSIVGGADGQRFISALVSAVNNNPTLADCEHGSIMSAALLGEALKLSPSPQLGQYYLVPFNDKNRGKVATFQLGYKGYIQLAVRSGFYKKLNVVAIKQGELIKYDPLNEEIQFRQIPDEMEREQAPSMGYYAMFEYNNGFKKTLYWSREKMEAHALAYSQGYKADKQKGTKYTFWSKDFDGMAYKTMLRQLISKWGIMSIDMQQAIDKDMAIVNENGTADYVESTPMSESISVDAIEQDMTPEAPTTTIEDDFFNGQAETTVA